MTVAFFVVICLLLGKALLLTISVSCAVIVVAWSMRRPPAHWPPLVKGLRPLTAAICTGIILINLATGYELYRQIENLYLVAISEPEALE